MSLFVDLEATLDEVCADALPSWTPLRESPDEADDDTDAGADLAGASFADALVELGERGRPARALRLVEAAPDPGEVAALLALPALRAVEALMLPLCRLSAADVSALVAGAPRTLRLLDLRQTAIGDAGMQALAASPLAEHLEHLAVAGSFLTVLGLRALLGSPLGKRAGSLHVEEEDQPESLIPSLMGELYAASKGDAGAAETAFAALLKHPALTAESVAELRYQWDLVRSN